MSKNITKHSSEEIQVPNTTLLTSVLMGHTFCRVALETLSGFGSMAMPFSGCGWEKWHTLPFSPRTTAPLPPPRPTFLCSHKHGSVYWLMLSTWTHPPRYWKNQIMPRFLHHSSLCQGFSISDPAVSFVRRPGGWQPAGTTGECLKMRLWGWKSCRCLLISGQGYAGVDFLLLFQSTFLYFVKCWHWGGKGIVLDQI